MPPAQKPKYVRLKVLVAGPHKIGKSCLIKNYCEGRFVKKYLPTIGIDYGVREIQICGQTVKINFFDISGAPEFKEIRTEFYSESYAIVFCYDVSDKTSLTQLGEIVEEFILAGAVQKSAAFLVGLRADQPSVVSDSDIAIMQNRLGCAGRTYKCSSVTGTGVADFFDVVFNDTYKKFYGTSDEYK